MEWDNGVRVRSAKGPSCKVWARGNGRHKNKLLLPSGLSTRYNLRAGNPPILITTIQLHS